MKVSMFSIYTGSVLGYKPIISILQFVLGKKPTVSRGVHLTPHPPTQPDLT